MIILFQHLHNKSRNRKTKFKILNELNLYDIYKGITFAKLDIVGETNKAK